MGIEGFDNDRWLNNEVNKSLADNGRIDKDEAKAMLDIIEKHGLEKIKINKKNLQKLTKALGYKFYNYNVITSGLVRRLKEKANIHNTTKNSISHLKRNIGKINGNIKLSDTTKYYNYSLNALSNSGYYKFTGNSKNIEYKALLGKDRIKVFKYINKYLNFLSPKEKESFANIIFFESVYGKYPYNKNKDGTYDIGPCMINNGATYRELKKHGIVKNFNNLKNWDTNFKAAAYIMKKYGFKRWYGRVPARKAGLYS